MQRNLIIGLILSILLVTFAIKNAEKVNINLWFWNVESSMALLLLITLLCGALLGVVFSIPAIKKRNDEIAELNKQLKELTGAMTLDEEDAEM